MIGIKLEERCKQMANYGFLLESSGSGSSTSGGFGGYTTIIMIVLLFVVMYFFMIRPQKKREKEDNAMRNALQVGDEVTTIGGIIGKVVSIKGETFVLETTKDKTKIRFLKGAIRTVDVKAADVAAQIIEANKEAEVADASDANQDAIAETEEKKD